MTPEEQAAADAAAAAAKQQQAEMISKAEADKAFKARDQAKAERNLLATELGIDPDQIKLVPTGDTAKPFKLEVEGMDEIKAAIAATKLAKLEQQKKTGKWDDRERELQTAHQTQMQTAAAKNGKTVAAYQKWLESKAVDAELRTALIAEGAIDTDGTGTYADLIALTKARVKVEQTVDEETSELVVKITALDANGQPMLDPTTGKTQGAKAVVADFLAKRPTLKKSVTRGGPGAGGYGGGVNRGTGGVILKGAARGEVAADKMFGKLPGSD